MTSMRYGPGGALVCDDLPPTLAGAGIPLLSDDCQRYYGGRYMVAESMSRGVAERIAEALGATLEPKEPT
jgi:hypothetical protein